MVDLRKSPSGKLVTVGDGPDGAFDPIQNVRWLDAESVVTPANGSIQAPFTDADEFLAEVTTGGWKLMLPANTTADFSIPDQDAGASLVFEGLSDNSSDVATIAVLQQTNAPALTFQHVEIGTLSLTPPELTSELTLSFESCEVHACTEGGTVLGTVKFVNCDVWAYSHTSSPTSFDGCSLGTPSGVSSIALTEGTVRNCIFRPNTTLAVVSTGTTLLQCLFGPGCFIDVASNEAITVDAFTYDQIITYVSHFDTDPVYTIIPWLPYIKQIDGVSFDVNPGSTLQLNLGPLLTEPTAQPQSGSGLCQVQFKTPTPNGSSVVCIAARLDNSGNVLVDVINLSLIATQSVSDPEFIVTYLPARSPNL